MCGALLIKLSLNPTKCSVEPLIRRVLRESMTLFHLDTSESGIQSVVIEAEVPIIYESESDYVEHERICHSVTRAIHCVAPGAVRLCSAIFLNDDDWFFPVQVTRKETTA